MKITQTRKFDPNHLTVRDVLTIVPLVLGTLNLQFDPTAAGAATSSLTITSNAYPLLCFLTLKSCSELRVLFWSA